MKGGGGRWRPPLVRLRGSLLWKCPSCSTVPPGERLEGLTWEGGLDRTKVPLANLCPTPDRCPEFSLGPFPG